MTNHEKFEELIPIYALKALDGDELKQFEEHLASGCNICDELLKEQEGLASSIAFSATPITPSSRLKNTVFDKIKTSKEIEKAHYVPNNRNSLRPVWFGLGGVALALLILLLVSNVYLRNKLRSQESEITSLKNQISQRTENMESLKSNLSAKEFELDTLKEQLASQTEAAEFLENPDVVVINLVGLQPDMKARGRVLWDTKNNKAFFYSLNLPTTPAGKTYQLWVIANSAPISAGIFNVDNKGDNIMKLESLPSPSTIQKFAVTLEPDGGVPQPTGEMYLIGES